MSCSQANDSKKKQTQSAGLLFHKSTVGGYAEFDNRLTEEDIEKLTLSGDDYIGVGDETKQWLKKFAEENRSLLQKGQRAIRQIKIKRKPALKVVQDGLSMLDSLDRVVKLKVSELEGKKIADYKKSYIGLIETAIIENEPLDTADVEYYLSEVTDDYIDNERLQLMKEALLEIKNRLENAWSITQVE